MAQILKDRADNVPVRQRPRPAGGPVRRSASTRTGGGRQGKAAVLLDEMQERLGVRDAVRRRALEIYGIATSKNMVRGRSIAALAASALYAACRETGAPVTLKDIQQASNTTRKDVARCYRLMLRELDIRMPVVDATACVERIAGYAGLSSRTRSEASKILREYSAGRVSAGKDPMGLAAAALYLVSNRRGEHKTQKMIADAADVTEVTIRNRYKGLRDALGIEE